MSGYVWDMVRVGVMLVAGTLWGCLAWGQEADPNNPLLKVDPNKEVNLKMFNTRSLDPKMAPYNQVKTPKAESRLTGTVPIKEAKGFESRQAGSFSSDRRWGGQEEAKGIRLSEWDGKKAEVGRRAAADGQTNEAPREVLGLSGRIEEPKIYLGPENPKVRSEAEVIRNTLGSIDSADQLREHRLTQEEIRRLLMTPERVRKAEAADKDPGITVDVAPRAIPVESDR